MRTSRQSISLLVYLFGHQHPEDPIHPHTVLLRPSTLRLLASELHHQENQCIRTDTEQSSNAGLIQVSERAIFMKAEEPTSLQE